MTTEVQTETSLQQHIDAALDAAWETLKQRELAAEKVQAQIAAERAAERASEWARSLQALRNAMPEWARQYLPTPDRDLCGRADYDLYYNYLTINIPGCVPIAAVSDGRTVVFDAFVPRMTTDDQGIRSVSVDVSRRRWWPHDIDSTEHDFAVALLTARQNYEAQQRMQAECNLVNQAPAAAKPPEPQPTPAQKRAAMLADTSELIRRFSEGDWLQTRDVRDADDDRVLLLATVGLTIAAQLGRIADVLEVSRG